MKILVHDLSMEAWEKIADQYEGYEVISSDKKINPCVGCFGCWIKTPGKCVIKDEYSDFGKRVSQAEELVLISKYTYGGFSSFVKNVLDRGISYMLPFFQIRKGEMHHKPRYNKHNLTIKVCFYGDHIGEEEKKIASTYVRAVALNYCTEDFTLSFMDNTFTESVKRVIKKEDIEKDNTEKDNTEKDNTEKEDIEKAFTTNTVLLNSSMRGNRANSNILLTKCKELMETEAQMIHLANMYHHLDELVTILASTKTLVIAAPLYVDGFPSALIKLLECMELRKDELKLERIYFISNMGFYEAHQICNFMTSAEEFCKTIGVEFGGGVAVGAGEMVGPLLARIPLTAGPCKNVGLALISLAKAVDRLENIGTVYCDASSFPRFAYFFMANNSWKIQIKETGLKKKDLYNQ